MASKAKNYIEQIHEEAKLRYSSGENCLDEWLEFTILETEDLISELDIVLEKYMHFEENCEEVKVHNCLRIIK